MRTHILVLSMLFLAACTTKIECPQYVPPGPGFCPGGTIVDGGYDVNHCHRPPTCTEAAPLTQELCTNAGGHWEECGSACRGADSNTPCTLQCVQYCACGGVAGFKCPENYTCGDYLPAGAADAMGICKPNAR